MQFKSKVGKIVAGSLFTLLATIPTACHKEAAVSTNPTASAEKITQFFAKQGVQTESFSLNAQKGGVIVTAQGTTFNIPENAFMDKNQRIVTGDVTILVKEIHKVSDMLFSNKPTVTSKGALLSSFGEFSIGAHQKESLELATGKSILATRPFKSVNGIAKSEVKNWFGDNSSARKGIEWLPMQENLAKLGKSEELEMVIRSLQWCNWDKLRKEKADEARTTLSVVFESNFNPKTNLEDKEGVFLSGVYFKPENDNTLFKCYEYLNKAYLVKYLEPLKEKNEEIMGLGTYSYGDIIPVGMRGKILAYSIIDEQYFVEVKEVTIEAGGFITVNPQPVEEKAFLQAVESLNEQ
ncbi:MAG: hypothetical protein RLZZ628_2297 [Bacteroidota bacterium]|jgi:hypothetical protein